MPRGPDWLLGFGFKAKDNGLGDQLKKYQKQFEGLAKSMKGFQKSSRGGGRSAGAGFDTESFSKSVKSSGSKSVLRGLESLNDEVSSVLQNVDKGLAHVNKTGRDIGLGLHKNIEKLFDEIESGAFKSAKSLDQIPEILTRIPLLTPKTIAALKKLHKELAVNKGDHKALTSTIKGLRKEIMKAVQESSGFEATEKKGGFGQVLKAWTDGSDLFAKTFDDAVKGADFVGEWFGKRFEKRFGYIFDKPGSLKGFVSALGDMGEEIKGLSIRTAKWVAKWTGLRGVFNKVLKPLGTFFLKKLSVPTLKLGKMFARVPLFDRLFGKKQKLKATRQEFDRIANDLGVVDDLAAFNKSKAAEFTPEEFAEKLKGDQQELEMRMAEASASVADDLSKMSVSAADDPTVAIFEAIEKAKAAPEPDKAAEQLAEAIATATESDDSSTGISNAVSELISKLKYDVAPAVADELAAITNLFMHGRKNIGEEALSLNKVISDSFEKLKHAYIEPLARSVGDALLGAKQKVGEFSADLKNEIEGSVSESFTKLRERINRTARTFNNLTQKADEAFFNILLDKEDFVRQFEENFQRLSSNVGLSIHGIGKVTSEEFRQMESSLRTVYSNLSTISAEGVVKQTEAISRGFVDLASTLDRITEPIVKNYEAIGTALKKAVGLNPFPVMAILSKLGPALARVGPAAGRAGAGIAGIEEAAASRGGAAAGGELGEMFQKKAMGMATENISSKIMDRIGQLGSMLKGGAMEVPKTAAPAKSSEGPSVSIIDAINSMSSRMAAEFNKLCACVNKQGGGAAPSAASGKLSVDSDEMKKVLSAGLKTIAGLAGKAR